MKKGKRGDDLSLEDNPLPYHSQTPIQKPSAFGTLFFVFFLVAIMVLLFRFCSAVVFNKEPSPKDFDNIEVYYAEYIGTSSLGLLNLSIVQDLCNCDNCSGCKIPIEEVIT